MTIYEQVSNSINEQNQGLTPIRYYHQQYLAKNPNGYCGLSGCNVKLNLEDILTRKDPK